MSRFKKLSEALVNIPSWTPTHRRPDELSDAAQRAVRDLLETYPESTHVYIELRKERVEVDVERDHGTPAANRP